MARNNTPTPSKGSVRCAIYTRKSSEEGLQQDFNSLDAQREACAAYIVSQKHEGWVALPQHYDDGGFSGGTIERPAVQRLLADIAADKIDVIVVYKVDRLTRSLADFARMVETFDASGVSFVAVTQQFNTTTSMGRLTLNVLLSFAQFEREVTGERIRDKIAASKKKGMWMGGNVPLGYDARDRQLLVNEVEAETIRLIFHRYLELGCVRLLKRDLEDQGVLSKARELSNGTSVGGKVLSRAGLYAMLRNPIYRGQIRHKGDIHEGLHDAIVDEALWDQVQAALDANKQDRREGKGNEESSLLAGILRDHNGARMTPSHAVANGRRYRYYVSAPLNDGAQTGDRGHRLPAGDIEALVLHRLRLLLTDRSAIFDILAEDEASLSGREDRAAEIECIGHGLPHMTPIEQRRIILQLVHQVAVHEDCVVVRASRTALRKLKQTASDRVNSELGGDKGDATDLVVDAKLKRVGLGKRIVVDGGMPDGKTSEPDPSLVRLIVRAHQLADRLFGDEAMTLPEAASAEGFGMPYATRLLRLTFLAPDIIQAIMEGRQPIELSARELMSDTRFALGWDEQRQWFAGG